MNQRPSFPVPFGHLMLAVAMTILLIGGFIVPLTGSAQEPDLNADRTAQYVVELIRKYDRNGDLRLSLDEVRNGPPSLTSESDKDQDGLLTAAEIYTEFSGGSPAPANLNRSSFGSKNQDQPSPQSTTTIALKISLYRLPDTTERPAIKPAQPLQQVLAKEPCSFSLETAVIMDQEATIQTSRRTPQITGVSTNRTGTQQRSVTFVETGSLLKLMPQSSGDQIVLQFAMEHSELADQGLPLTENAETGDVTPGPAELETLTINNRIPLQTGQPSISTVQQGKSRWYIVIEAS